MCDFDGVPQRFRLMAFFPGPLKESINGGTYRSTDVVYGTTVFENVPFHGGISYDKYYGMQQEDSATVAAGLYYVTCTGSHYVYYDSNSSKFYHIERIT
jgi:hypothetical protein